MLRASPRATRRLTAGAKVRQLVRRLLAHRAPQPAACRCRTTRALLQHHAASLVAAAVAVCWPAAAGAAASQRLCCCLQPRRRHAHVGRQGADELRHQGPLLLHTAGARLDGRRATHLLLLLSAWPCSRRTSRRTQRTSSVLPARNGACCAARRLLLLLLVVVLLLLWRCCAIAHWVCRLLDGGQPWLRKGPPRHK
jgi:hypothetical protein